MTILQVAEVPSVRRNRFGSAKQQQARSVYPQINSDNGIRHLFHQQMVQAKRAGTWFMLRIQERGMFELALRLKVKLRSPELLKALVSVLKGLMERFDAGHRALMKAMGIAWAFSEVAVRAGNQRAREWRHDWNYVRFLAKELVFA